MMKNFVEITSKDNALIKFVSKLQKSSKFRYSENKFVIEGLRITEDAAENGVQFDSLIVNNSFYNRYLEKLKNFSKCTQKCYLLTDSLFEKICDTDSPQGIIVVANMPSEAKTIDKTKRYIALDNLQDPSNLGAIARTSEALGIGGIIINNASCDPFSPKSIRASMGTLLRMPLFLTDNLISFFKENALKSYACVVDKTAENIADINFGDSDVIIIGNEANGISDEVKKNSDRLVTIPMSGKAESLNAAAAAAIALYELSK